MPSLPIERTGSCLRGCRGAAVRRGLPAAPGHVSPACRLGRLQPGEGRGMASRYPSQGSALCPSTSLGTLGRPGGRQHCPRRLRPQGCPPSSVSSASRVSSSWSPRPPRTRLHWRTNCWVFRPFLPCSSPSYYLLSLPLHQSCDPLMAATPTIQGPCTTAASGIASGSLWPTNNDLHPCPPKPLPESQRLPDRGLSPEKERTEADDHRHHCKGPAGQIPPHSPLSRLRRP